MHRDIHRLGSRRFDLLVVGGGIYGVIIACDAALRGLEVALIERDDFGAGTSFNHLRTIHGGLRYLQTLDLTRARESIRERRTLAQIAPAAITPLPFVLPLTSALTRGPLALRAAFLLDGMVASDRNDGVPASHVLPRGRVLSTSEAQREFPGIDGLGPQGAAVWFDYLTAEPERLMWAWIQTAHDHGAVVANYVEAMAVRVEGTRIDGVDVVDRCSGDTFRIAARTVVNATGGSIDRLLTPLRIPTAMPLIKAMNLVTTIAAPPYALGGWSPARKTLFMVPWRGRALFGTWESSTPHAPSDLGINSAEVSAFIAEVNHAFPSLRLTTDDVSLVHRGIVPAVRRQDGSLTLDGQERVFDHGLDGVTGLISVAGTKYTTARAVAERIVDSVCDTLGVEAPCITTLVDLPVVVRSGDDALVHAAHEELAVTLEDVLLRRTGTGALGHPGQDVLMHAAEIVGGACGWDSARREQEIAALEHRYGTSKA
jgi:glycerol-3-phosphate dehydrogenase